MAAQVASVLPCSALRCQERMVIHAASPLHIDTVRERAAEAGWRHDADGDWCPWHSPAQEAAARATTLDEMGDVAARVADLRGMQQLDGRA